MANNTTFRKPVPPGKQSRTKKRHSRKIPSPVLTSIAINTTQSIPTDLLPSAQVPTYRLKKVGTPNTYRFQNRGPPKKRLPTKKLPQISQTPTPLTTKQKAALKHRSSNADHSLGLEMSMTSHVGADSQQYGNRHLNHLNQPIHTMKKTVSANDIANYMPVQSHYNNVNGQHTFPQYNQHTQQQIFIPPPPPPPDKHKSQKRKSSGNKRNKTMHIFDVNGQTTSQKPTINTMKQLIERAETFGQTPSHGQIHSNQAPQIPVNNSIFDNSDSENNMDGYGMEHKENYNIINEINTSDNFYELNGERSRSRQNMYLPSDVVPPPSMTNKKHERFSQLKSTETQITNLKNEINELESLLKQKKQQVTILEKEKLENSIDHLKPITLLKRFNEFCQIANGEELDMLQAIVSQSIQ